MTLRRTVKSLRLPLQLVDSDLEQTLRLAMPRPTAVHRLLDLGLRRQPSALLDPHLVLRMARPLLRPHHLDSDRRLLLLLPRQQPLLPHRIHSAVVSLLPLSPRSDSVLPPLRHPLPPLLSVLPARMPVRSVVHNSLQPVEQPVEGSISRSVLQPTTTMHRLDSAIPPLHPHHQALASTTTTTLHHRPHPLQPHLPAHSALVPLPQPLERRLPPLNLLLRSVRHLRQMEARPPVASLLDSGSVVRLLEERHLWTEVDSVWAWSRARLEVLVDGKSSRSGGVLSVNQPRGVMRRARNERRRE